MPAGTGSSVAAAAPFNGDQAFALALAAAESCMAGRVYPAGPGGPGPCPAWQGLHLARPRSCDPRHVERAVLKVAQPGSSLGPEA
jgi:hypothetical protein